ncbi:hypothetical protein AK812_SmicGene7093 [Symbiodinium microadriaticum]|uniref:Uncharacterized protein n=1 Tax=Symbiodinium microadriaticum TaxID=2951 RepID=A0A1Q9EPJ3_SYMMI|nr:hypothetical protein AK812_SmicGene7093 [Symbiodinium microadriaticum]
MGCPIDEESAQNDHATMVQSILKNKEMHIAKIQACWGGSGRAYAGLKFEAWSFFKMLDMDDSGDVEVSIESAGEETWQKVTRGQQRQTGHDPLRQGSCDLVVMQSMDIVQMLKQHARPLFGGQTWEAAPDRPALIEVTFCSALIWLKVYQLERFLTLVLCMGGVAFEVVSAGVIINGQPLTCEWAEGLQHFPKNGPVRTLVEMWRFHIVHMPMARVDEVDRIFEKLDTKTQELDTKTQELDTKTQELDTKIQELTSARSELVLRGAVKSFTDDSYVAYSETSAPASFVALGLVQCLVD